MISDYQNQFAEAQEVTASAPSEVLDAGAAGSPLSPDLFLVISVDEAVTASGGATVEFKLRTAAAVDTATPPALSSPTTLFSSGPIAKALLTLGAQPVKVKVPPGLKRYSDVYFDVGTGPLLTGEFSAVLALDTDVHPEQ